METKGSRIYHLRHTVACQGLGIIGANVFGGDLVKWTDEKVTNYIHKVVMDRHKSKNYKLVAKCNGCALQLGSIAIESEPDGIEVPETHAYAEQVLQAHINVIHLK